MAKKIKATRGVSDTASQRAHGIGAQRKRRGGSGSV